MILDLNLDFTNILNSKKKLKKIKYLIKLKFTSH